MGLFDILKKKDVSSVNTQVTVNQPTNVEVQNQVVAQPTQTGYNSTFVIEDVFTIMGRGTVVTGKVLSGTFCLNDVVTISEKNRQTRITGIEMFRKQCNMAQAGDHVGLCLSGIAREDVAKGYLIVNNSATVTVPVPQLEPTVQPTVQVQVQPAAPVIATSNSNSIFSVESVFTNSDKCTVITGKVLSGTFCANDVVTIKETNHQTVIARIDMFRNPSNIAKTGDYASLYLSNTSKAEVSEGYTIVNNSAPASISAVEAKKESAKLIVKEIVGQSAEGLVVNVHIEKGILNLKDVVTNMNGNTGTVVKVVMLTRELGYCMEGDNATLTLSGLPSIQPNEYLVKYE